MALGTGYFDGYVLADGVRTHYSWAGTEGPAVVLLHGGGPGSSGESGWRQMLPALAQGGYRAFAPDQLSMGWTDARPHAWPVLGHQSLVDHVNDFVDALCLDEVSVVGNSQGAYVAAKFSLDHPEKVTKAFFIASGTICQSMGINRPPGPASAGMAALATYDYTVEGQRRFLSSILLKEPSEELVLARHEAATRPGIKESREAFQNYVTSMREDPKLFNRFSLKDSMPKFAIPASFVWGNLDAFAPVELGHELAKALPQIPFTFLDDCGHQAQNDQPELVNQLVIDFLKEK